MQNLYSIQQSITGCFASCLAAVAVAVAAAIVGAFVAFAAVAQESRQLEGGVCKSL